MTTTIAPMMYRMLAGMLSSRGVVRPQRRRSARRCQWGRPPVGVQSRPGVAVAPVLVALTFMPLGRPDLVGLALLGLAAAAILALAQGRGRRD